MFRFPEFGSNKMITDCRQMWTDKNNAYGKKTWYHALSEEMWETLFLHDMKNSCDVSLSVWKQIIVKI